MVDGTTEALEQNVTNLSTELARLAVKTPKQTYIDVNPQHVNVSWQNVGEGHK